MRQLRIHIVIMVISIMSLPAYASWGSINIDAKTDAAMSGAYLAEWQTERMSDDVLGDILKHYSSASVATAGIYSSKWMDRKALKNAGLFTNARENYYYRRIYTLVSAKIMPKIWYVATQMVKEPDKALYWGPYLFKTCEEIKQLCMIFETVVANGKITFQDIAFLSINDKLRGLFDLAQLADVDWRAVWEHLVEFGDGLTKEALMEDLQTLIQKGASIASAGASVLVNQGETIVGRVTDVMSGNWGNIFELYDDFQRAYELLQSPGQIKDLLMHEILTNDEIGVSRLFQLEDYNITSYMSDYLHEMQGQYYTQLWTIGYQEKGSKYVCKYDPPTLNTRYMNAWFNPDYSYFNTSSPLTSDQQETARIKSENIAGWSRVKVNELNRKGDGHTYTIRLTAKQYSGFKGYQPIQALAYSVYVQDTWNMEEEVYEELFDSQTMTLSGMQAKMNAKLVEYNRNEEGKVYTIQKGPKHYYQAPDEERLKGVESVSFIVNCSDGAELGEGAHSWKVQGHHGSSLGEDSKNEAMASTLPSSPDTSEWDAEIANVGSRITSIQAQIRALQEENRQLSIQIAQAEDGSALRAKYNANLNAISSLQAQLSQLQTTLSEMQQGREEMLADYTDGKDDFARIPSVMHDLEVAYQIKWIDAGYWDGFTYIRHGRIVEFDNGIVTFSAKLSLQRKPKYILGKRVHRAILAFNWKLAADYSSSDVVDMMTLDMSMSERERVAAVNKRQSEIQKEYPECSVELNYAYSDSLSVDTDDSYHLLWISDRLMIARQVTYRLDRIYAELVLLEKFLSYRTTLLDCLKAELLSPITGQRKSWVGNEALRRWRDCAHHSSGIHAFDESE